LDSKQWWGAAIRDIWETRWLRLQFQTDPLPSFCDNNSSIMLSRLLSALSFSTLLRGKDAPVLLNIGLPSCVPHPTLERSGITFSVDAVAPAEKPIWTESLADSLNRRFQRKILVLPEREKLVTNATVDFLKRKGRAGFDLARAGSRCHPLIDAVHVAFSQHRPLILSPDDIWLVIAQGFGHHVTENSEVLRHRLVRHQGRRELGTTVDDLSLASFERAIAEVSSKIQEATDPVLHETLVCDFSTTTPAICTASEVALMASRSPRQIFW
jgi:Domain of unknown function (DUF4419)